MHKHIPFLKTSRCGIVAVATLLLAIAAHPVFASTQDTGEAAAAKVNIQAVITLLGTLTPSINTSLADIGTLTSNTDKLQASMLSGSVTSVLNGQAIHAVTAAASDGVISEASLSNVGLNVAGNTIGASFVMARANAPVSGAAGGSSQIEDLLVNGTLITVTGAANQVIPLLGGRIVLNEQQLNSDGSMVVNAIHVTIAGVADVVVASARAGVGSTSSGGLTLPLLGMSVTTTVPTLYAAYLRSLSAACMQTMRLSETV